MKAKDKPHYVNNAQFSQAVVDYVTILNEKRENSERLPKVPDYVAMCFMKIAEGLSHKSNFIRYTYREEMVMDAVENCLKAIENYDIAAATRTGKPNAFAYFTQICWYAFLRRIQKEKKQQDIKIKYMLNSPIDDFIGGNVTGDANVVLSSYVDQLKSRIENVKIKDSEIAEIVKRERKRSTKTSERDSDLGEILG
jgi:hypothetical protein